MMVVVVGDRAVEGLRMVVLGVGEAGLHEP